MEARRHDTRMPSDFHFTIKNRISELGPLTQGIHTSLQPFELSDKVRYWVDLVCDELITNIIKYGHSDGSEHDIVVQISVRPDAIVIEFEDDGRPFNPLIGPSPDVNAPVEERPIGGLGIHLLREMMDACEYRYVDGTNHLILKRTR